jgi:hypothetical protein
MLEVKEVKLSNLGDCSKVCIGASLPPGLDSFAAVDIQRAKLAFFRAAKGLGAGARAAYRDGALVGILEWYPVEASPTPVAGKDIFVVNCARVSDRAARSEVLAEMVRAAEEAWSKRAGVAALGRNRSWEEYGFERIDSRRAPEKDGGSLTLYLKRNRPEAEASLLEPVRPPKPEGGKIRVDIYVSDRCPWNGFVFDMVRRACAKYGKPIQILEHDCRSREGVEKNGIGGGIAVNGEFRALLRPHLLPDERAIHKLLDLA